MRKQGCSQKGIVRHSARDFGTNEGFESKEYFVYFKIQNRTVGAKDPLRHGKMLQECAPIKRERGEFHIHPAVAPVSRMSAQYACGISHVVCSLGGQNLAALGTTAGQNLAAVGSSHSLTETVDLGTMTTAGLVGTLHKFTPPILLFFICSTAKFGRSNT